MDQRLNAESVETTCLSILNDPVLLSSVTRCKGALKGGRKAPQAAGARWAQGCPPVTLQPTSVYLSQTRRGAHLLYLRRMQPAPKDSPKKRPWNHDSGTGAPKYGFQGFQTVLAPSFKSPWAPQSQHTRRAGSEIGQRPECEAKAQRAYQSTKAEMVSRFTPLSLGCSPSELARTMGDTFARS